MKTSTPPILSISFKVFVIFLQTWIGGTCNLLLQKCVSDKEDNFPAHLSIQLSVCLLSVNKKL